MVWQARQYLSYCLALSRSFSARSSISRSEYFGGISPVRSRWQFQQTSNWLSISSLQLEQVQKVFDMHPLLVLVQIFAVGLLDAKLLQTILQGAEGEAEEL